MDDTAIIYESASGGVEEILRPTLVIGGGRRYRKLTDVDFGRRPEDREREREKRRAREETNWLDREGDRELQQENLPEEVWSGMAEMDEGGPYSVPYTDDVYDEGQDIESELKGVEKLPSGNYKLKLSIPSVFYKYIIGKEGKLKKGIERDTECRLWIPSRGREGDVVIEGLALSSVADAKKRVEIIVWTNRDNERPTHFISIPLTQPHIKERMAEFRTVVMDSCRQDRGVVSEQFQHPERFHITLGVLRIFTPEEMEKAKEVVKEAISTAKPLLGDEPAVMCLEGVDTMNDDPTAVNVLFAKVVLSDHSDRLQAFVDAVVSHVIERAPDLMSREFDREGIKLHATLMNPMAMAKDAAGRERGGREGNWRRRDIEPQRKPPSRQPFDATKILKRFGDFHFGQQSLDTLHLSKRKEFGPDGFYKCELEYCLSDIPPA